MAKVELCGVSHHYPGASVATLDDINLEIADGEAHALLGGSGAGKSTLLNLLSGLTGASAGTIEFNGAATPRPPVAQVFQFPVLYEGLSVAGNLGFVLKNAGWNRASRAARVAEIAKMFDIADLLKRRPAALSLFQKQLVAIAKALTRPDIALTLLDEPLTAVEPATKWRLRTLLKSIQRKVGMTMIYVTHDQTEALTFADRISVLHEGRIVQTDTAQMLYQEPVHEHVGYFIGSPGMNFLDGEVRERSVVVQGQRLGQVADVSDGALRIGFRPEAAVIRSGTSDGLEVDILRSRIEHADGVRRLGLLSATCGGAPVVVRQDLADYGRVDHPPTGRLVIDLSSCGLFRDGWRLEERPS